MKKIVLLFMILGFVLVSYGQKKSVEEKFVEIPSDTVLLTIANQPNCPIKIEKAKILFSLDNRAMRIVYELRNTSDKAIKNFALSKWHLGGGGGDLASITLDSNNLLLPGQMRAIGESKNIVIFPLDENLRKELDLKKEMVSVIVLFVKEVWFVDRTKYENETMLDNFIDFSNRVVLEKNN